MKIRKFNWLLWAGLLLSLIAFLSYPFFFVKFPVTRDFPWANLVLFGVAAVLVLLGVRRGFSESRSRPTRSKVAGIILATLSLAVFGFFVFAIFIMARHLPESKAAPQVGQKAPDFTLPDTNGKPVSLSQLLAPPAKALSANSGAPRGALLIFYRGYWCPACNSELRGIQDNLAKLEEVGIRPVAISVDTPEASRKLCDQAGYTFSFLSDSKAEVIRRYDLLHQGAGIDGQDVARPAEFLVDSTGTVRWVNLTENYWVRARPEEIIDVAKMLR